MSIDFSTGNISINGTTTMTVNSSGIITAPRQAAFYAKDSATPVATDTVIFTTAVYNIGSCYNVSNGRFTAPNTGTYFFGYHQLTASASTGEFRVSFQLNGADYGTARTILTKPAGYYSIFNHCHIRMSAGDYVSVYIMSTTGTASFYTSTGYDAFSGYMVC